MAKQQKKAGRIAPGPYWNCFCLGLAPEHEGEAETGWVILVLAVEMATALKLYFNIVAGDDANASMDHERVCIRDVSKL